MRTFILLALVALAAGCRSFTAPGDRVLNDRRIGQLAAVATDDHLVLLDQKSGQVMRTAIPSEYAAGFSQGAIFLREGAERLAEASFNGDLSEEHYVELYEQLLHVSADLARLELELAAGSADSGGCDGEACTECDDCDELAECIDACEELVDRIEQRATQRLIEDDVDEADGCCEDGECSAGECAGDACGGDAECSDEQGETETFTFRIRTFT